MSYLLAINCGSSSIKGKLYHLPASTTDPLAQAASLSVSNISSKGEKIKIKIGWNEEEGRDVNEEGDDGGEVECEFSDSSWRAGIWHHSKEGKGKETDGSR
jgi:acetate kinase